MPGVGASGGYGPPLNTLGMTGIEYPPGPAGWTANADWSAMPGSVFRAADLNQQLSLPLDYLTNPPMFQAIQQTPQTIPVNTGPATLYTSLNLTLDTPLVDSWGMWNPDTAATEWQVPVGMDGVYLISATVPMTVKGANFQYQCEANDQYFSLVGGQNSQVTASSGQVMMQFLDLGLYQGGDYFIIEARSNSTTAVPTAVTSGSGNTPSVSAVLSGRWVASNLATSPLPSGYSFPLTVPTPTAWTTGQALTSASLNSQIRDSLVFLANRPYCRAQGWTNQSVPSGTTTLTGMYSTIQDYGFGGGNSFYADPWGSWNSSTSTWTAPIAGLYLCCLSAGFNSSYNASNTTAFSMNPSIVVVQSGVSSSLSGGKSYGLWPQGNVMRTVRFAAGDTLKPVVFHTSSTAQNVTVPMLFTLWLRP